MNKMSLVLSIDNGDPDNENDVREWKKKKVS